MTKLFQRCCVCVYHSWTKTLRRARERQWRDMEQRKKINVTGPTTTETREKNVIMRAPKKQTVIHHNPPIIITNYHHHYSHSFFSPIILQTYVYLHTFENKKMDVSLWDMGPAGSNETSG